MQKISSAQNPKLKAAIQLHGSRGRKKQQRFIVFGDRESHRALSSGVSASEIFVREGAFSNEQFFAGLPSSAGSLPVYELPAELMDKLEYGGRSDGVVLVAERPQIGLEKLKPNKQCLTVVLEAIEKPGNLGAVLRSCDGAGVDAVIVGSPLTDFFHPNCIRASMGAVFSLQLAAGSTGEVRDYLKSNNFTIFPAVVDAKQSYRQADFTTERAAIVFGNEASGLSDAWKSEPHAIYIPMAGIADSLNVSVSAAIVAYEAAGQRGRN